MPSFHSALAIAILARYMIGPRAHVFIFMITGYVNYKIPIAVILHIGAHKTEATTVQSFLQANRHRLTGNRIDFLQGFLIS